MISTRIFAISTLWAVLSTALPAANDFSRYREFQFGMNLLAVAKQAQMNPSDAKMIHRRPVVIQELDWQRRGFPNSPETDPVEEVLFSFCNGELFRMVVTYDRAKTAGLTAEDLIAAISAQYGTATTPDAEIIFPSLYHETVKVIARWENSQYSLSLVRSSYQPSFGMVVLSKRLDALAQAATTEALRLDQQEAPQREIERNQREDDENRIQQERARRVNKPGFRP